MGLVIKQEDTGALLWAPRLHALDGMLEQWRLWSPAASQLVVVPQWVMNDISPSGQLVLVTPMPAGQVNGEFHCHGVEGMAGEEARDLWEYHLGQALSGHHGQMILALWRFCANLPAG